MLLLSNPGTVLPARHNSYDFELSLGGVVARQRAFIFPENGHVLCGGGRTVEGGT